ncbi:adhesion G-protein coupled receptor G2 isoform X3 [Hemicordylus capensis]|nr:adhesion G-protein coupled receptor G2 isoform X3 [Hemicordylus capensis]XP_053168965.1 adhesion G-protein coupled receptor G2 isoform X3 [Hemicordylus capensis]
MMVCGVHNSCADRVWGCLLKCKISFSLLLLHLFLAASGKAQDGFFGQYRAVFNTSCDEVWTLSATTIVPTLENFTVCIYLKLYNTKNPWTAFVYKTEEPGGNLSADHYELGLTGEHDKLTVWIFGKEITVPEKLDNNTWYQACIEWRGKDHEMSLYINNEEKKTENISKTGKLIAKGQLLLGCSQKPGTSSSSPVGMVGELYMFRMWARAEMNNTQDCHDGSIIRWRKNYWVYNKTAQYSSSLPCANLARWGKASGTTLADSSIVTFVTYPNSATDSSSIESFSSAETANVTELNFSPTAGMKVQYNHVCNLSALCKDTVFYTGTMKFQTSKNSSKDSYNLKLHFPGDNTSQYQLTVPPIILETEEFDISDFNKTLQNLSESSIMQCRAENESATDCSFIIKLEKKMNIRQILANLQAKAELSPIELCCCSTLHPNSCPSTAKELQLLQCGVHEPVACAGPSTSGLPVSPVAPSMMTSTVITQHGSPSPESTTVSPPPPQTEPKTTDYPSILGGQITTQFFPSTEQNTVILPVAPPTGSNNAIVSSATTNRVLTTVSSTKPTTASSVVMDSSESITAVSRPTSFAKSTAAVSSAMPSPASNMNTSSDMHSTTDDIGSSELPPITNTFNASDVEKIVSKLEEELSAENIAPALAREMVNRVSQLLNIPEPQISPMSKRIIKIVDAIGLKVNFSTESINMTSPSLALAVLKVNSSFFSKVSFAVEASSDLQVTLGNQAPTKNVGAITLPSSVMGNLSSKAMQEASRITFNFFEKTTLFQDPSLKNLSLISHVISSSVANLTINNLKTNVTVTLQNAMPTQVQTELEQEHLTVRCAFWDFTKNGGKGGWSYEGCVVTERRTNETICSCNHLTSFGVLLDLSRNPSITPVQVLILTFITYIGCGLSAIFLSITLVTYIAFEKIRRDYPSKILIQLCVALLLLNLVFLLNSWIALSNIRGVCISVALFLHYFLLASFTWMGLEAFHMYLALVKVFNTYVRKYILKFCIIGWGVPAIIVAIVLAISPDNYGLGSYGKFPNGSSDEFCWINNNVVFYITVVGYFCIIFLLNISMFIVVLIQLCRIKKKKQLGTQRKTSIQDLRSIAGITFLLGITWGFAFFAWGPVNLVFMYLFAIFNTLQGFFIFIFYCVAKENVRKQWRRYLCCGKYRLAENSDWSRTATNGLKKQNVNQGVSSSSHSLQSNSNSTNSTSVLMNNDYSVHANGNGNVSSEKNGVAFNVQNGDVRLHDFSGKQIVFHENNDTGHKKPRISLRRTSKRGNLHFIEPM